MGDYDWIAPLVSGVAKGAVDIGTGLAANGQTQAALDEMLRNIAAQQAKYDSLGDAGYQNIAAQQVGPSALEGVQVDPAALQSQQEALALLSQMAQGGLLLGDKVALNDIQANLNRNDSARQANLANQFAARGQLGAGAQLGMALQGQSDAAMNASRRGEGIAAQAQQRGMDALLQKGAMSRGMANDDYARKAEAARARDAIEARNAAARTQAAMANNAIAGQRYGDQFQKLNAQTGLLDRTNQQVFNKGSANKNTTKAMGGYANNLIDTGASAYDAYNTADNRSLSQKAGDEAWDDEDN